MVHLWWQVVTHCVIDNSGGHDGIADDNGNGEGYLLVGIWYFSASLQPDIS